MTVSREFCSILLWLQPDAFLYCIKSAHWAICMYYVQYDHWTSYSTLRKEIGRRYAGIYTVSHSRLNRSFWPFLWGLTLQSHHTVNFTLIDLKKRCWLAMCLSFLQKKNLNISSKLNILHYFKCKTLFVG